MPKAEKLFENKVKGFLKNEGVYFVKQFGCAFTSAGIPDLLICCNGHFLGVEIKAENGKPSQLQLMNITKIKQAGGIALVLYPKDFDYFKKLIKDLKNDNI